MKSWQRNLAIVAGVGVGVVVLGRQAAAGVRDAGAAVGEVLNPHVNPTRDTNPINRAYVATLKWIGLLPDDATTVAPLVPGYQPPPTLPARLSDYVSINLTTREQEHTP